MFGSKRQANNDSAPLLGGDCGCQESAPAPVDPRRPAQTGPATTIEGLLAGISAQLANLSEQLTPGAPGRQNAEPIPEFLTYAGTATTATGPVPIVANGRRTSLVVHNLGPETLYVVSAAHLSASDGLPVPIDTERELKVRNHLWLISTDAAWRAGEETT